MLTTTSALICRYPLSIVWGRVKHVESTCVISCSAMGEFFGVSVFSHNLVAHIVTLLRRVCGEASFSLTLHRPLEQRVAFTKVSYVTYANLLIKVPCESSVGVRWLIKGSHPIIAFCLFSHMSVQMSLNRYFFFYLGHQLCSWVANQIPHPSCYLFCLFSFFKALLVTDEVISGCLGAHIWVYVASCSMVGLLGFFLRVNLSSFIQPSQIPLLSSRFVVFCNSYGVGFRGSRLIVQQRLLQQWVGFIPLRRQRCLISTPVYHFSTLRGPSSEGTSDFDFSSSSGSDSESELDIPKREIQGSEAEFPLLSSSSSTLSEDEFVCPRGRKSWQLVNPPVLWSSVSTRFVFFGFPFFTPYNFMKRAGGFRLVVRRITTHQGWRYCLISRSLLVMPRPEVCQYQKHIYCVDDVGDVIVLRRGLGVRLLTFQRSCITYCMLSWSRRYLFLTPHRSFGFRSILGQVQ